MLILKAIPPIQSATISRVMPKLPRHTPQFFQLQARA
jgi:hypothetical protein